MNRVLKRGQAVAHESAKAPSISEEFRRELATLLNRYSLELPSNTPDFILADYLATCLENWNAANARRVAWLGFEVVIAGVRNGR